VKGPAPVWTFLLPSCWFVSLCQTLRGRANPAMVELAKLCLPGIVAVAAIAFGAYAISYRRHFVRVAETAEGTVTEHRPARWRFGILERWVLRTPFQKGCFRFVSKTLLRSEAHRLVMTAVTGLALVLASQALMNAFDGAPSWRKAAMTAEALSIPFIVTFLLIVGLRIVFEVPAELRANWIFQLVLDADGRESEPLARNVMLVAVLPWVLSIAFVVYLYLEGLVVALLHATLVMVWAVLLTNIALVRFRKLAFTCSLPVFKQHSIVIVIAFCFGFLIYAVSTPEFESSALLEPVRMLSLVPVALVAWYVPRYLGRSTIEMEKRMIFEEVPVRTVERLRLSE
jgi:hypothetical protein